MAFKNIFGRNKGLTEKPSTSLGKQITAIGSQQTAPSMNQRQVAEAFATSPFLHLCVDKIAKSVASNDWKLYTITPKGDKNLTLSHELLTLLSRPNPFMTKFDMFYTIQAQLDLSGNSYVMYERNSQGIVTSIYPIVQDMIVEYPNGNNGYTYKIQLNSSLFRVPCTELIHIKEVNVNKPYGNGMSTATTLGNQIQIEDYTAKRINSFFFNDSQPSGIIGINDISEDSLLEFKEKWLSESQGFFNAYKMKFLNTSEITYIPTQANFSDSKILEVSKQQQEVIRIAFGISPEVLGIVESSNRATAMTAKELYTTEVIEPRLIRIRDILNITLVKEFGNNLFLDYSKKSSATTDRMLQLVQLTPQAFQLNEIRELAGLEVVTELKGIYGGTSVKSEVSGGVIEDDIENGSREIK